VSAGENGGFAADGSIERVLPSSSAVKHNARGPLQAPWVALVVARLGG
jgi:hypothetical protein